MNLFGGEVGVRLALELLAVTAVAFAAGLTLRRLPGIRQRKRLPDLVFAAALVLQLAVLAERSLRPLDIDVDTLSHATSLMGTHTLGEAIQARRGTWAADYLLQGPIVHALRSVLPLDPLGSWRLLAFAGATATALLLRYGALRLGAGPWAAVLAGLLPLYAFGPAWLVLSLDDNAPASALEWAFFFALTSGLSAAREGRGGAAALLRAGLLLGLAISFHRKALLWGLLLPLAPLVSRELRNARVLCPLAITATVAALTHLLAAWLFLPGGEGLPAGGMSRLLQSPHHANPAWWFPSSDLGLAAQALSVWHGLSSSLIVFPLVTELLLEPSPFYVFQLLVPLCLAAAMVAVWRTWTDPRCRLLSIALAIQFVHSLLYEPGSVERWDTIVVGAGLLVAVSTARGPGTRVAWRTGTAWLWLMLATVQHLSTGLYGDAMEVARRLGGQVTEPAPDPWPGEAGPPPAAGRPEPPAR